MSFKAKWKLHLLCFLIALMICLSQQDNISNIFMNLYMDKIIINFTGNDFLDMNIFILLILIPVTFVHELLHGVTYKLFGGKVKYGFKGVYAYAQEISGIALHRTKFLVVLLAPVTIISIATILISGSIGAIIFLLNLLGSTGDLVMALYLCKSNKNSYIVDKSYGFDVINR